MNPVEAVEALGAARAPSATLQALADAVAAATAPQGPGLAEESPAPGDAAAASLRSGHDRDYLAPVAAADTGVAVQGRMTLGQLATEQAALRDAPDPTGADRGQPGSPLPAEATSPRQPAQVLAVPVLLNPLQPPPPPPPRHVDREPPLHDRGRHPSPFDDRDTDDDEREAPAFATDEPAPPQPDPEAAALHALLRRERQAEALAELARGRRVIVVLPQAVPAAVAWLVGPQRAQRFGARWWPGATRGDAWPRWRVFRDGDPLLTRGLVSRAGGAGCRVRLGAPALRLSDAESAALEIAERIRFAQALGGQWSVVLLVAPEGCTP